MQLMDAARQVKHAAFVGSKRARWKVTDAKWAALTAVTPTWSRLRPYQYDAQRYSATELGRVGHNLAFLHREAPVDAVASQLPRRVFAVWAGDNELTVNRQRNLAALREELDVPVVLVTPENLSEWLVDGHPLRPGYEHLSLVHRSDYLRAYLSHHHGGGYVDIKAPVGPWAASFERMEADPDAWVTGYREIGAGAPARFPGAMGRDLATHWTRLVGCGAMIVRSHTPFTGEWLREVERRVDFAAPQAAEHPGGVRGEDPGYPVSWTDLLGKVFQPLQFKHLAHVRVDDRLLLEFENYQ